MAQTPTDRQPHHPQRRGPDLLLRLLPWICGCGWLILILAVYLGASAKPQLETVIERWHGKEVRTVWNMAELHWMFRLAVVSFCLSLTGMGINSRRLKRKDDEFRVNLILLALAAVLTFVWYFSVV